MNHPVRLLILCALLSSSLTLLALRLNLVPGFEARQTVPPALASGPAGQPPMSSDEEINIRVYEQVSPGVVNITRTFLEYDYYFLPVAREGTGSGCVLDKQGHILTNLHVIEPAESLEVSLPDRTRYHATIVGIDRQNDLAVIRVDAPSEKLHPVTFGDSSLLKVGQKVLAIGNPLGLQNTLTVGIVSSTGRRIRTQREYLVDNVIQTDAAINPGNSGGPLLNTAGEMVGINTSIFTIGGGNIGIGFAIPSNTVRRVADELIRFKKVTRPYFGIEGYVLDKELSSALSLPVSSGILVARVERGSSADRAGIRGASRIALFYNNRIMIGGDIITEIDGKPVASMEELQLALESRKPGETVQATIYRGNSKMLIQVPLLEAPRRQRNLL